MADTQKRGVSSQNAGQQHSYAERRPEAASAPSAGKKKRSKRDEYMLNQYIYETRQEQLPINEMFVQKYG